MNFKLKDRGEEEDESNLKENLKEVKNAYLFGQN